jgi:prepilin-type N-terminal cleavage/methylation domain-containing protein
MMMGCELALARTRLVQHERGFTLTELMVVVTMVGILSMIGVASFRKQIFASKSNEAANVVQAIRAAQESYRSENQSYMNVSTPGRWYPATTFGQTAYEWHQTSHGDYAAWQRLNVLVTQGVQFRYQVNAGGPGATLPTLQIADPGWPTPNEPWYVVQARANYDGNSVYCDAVASSFNGELYIQNEGE